MSSCFRLYTESVKQHPVKYIVGIDEVGRGPLAGPVAVGVVVATKQALRKFRAIKESKQLTRAQREAWFARIIEAQSFDLRFAVAFVSAGVIDKKGIAPAIRTALARALKQTGVHPDECEIRLDGGLHAPAEFVRQQTIIKGDEKETTIAMASVIAKVLRDRRMYALAKKYPQYGFERHVGYGTAAHIAAIKKNGLLPEHRKSFCRNIRTYTISK